MPLSKARRPNDIVVFEIGKLCFAAVIKVIAESLTARAFELLVYFFV